MASVSSPTPQQSAAHSAKAAIAEAKKKLTKVDPPKEDDFKIREKQENDRIQELQAKVQDLNNQIKSKQGGRDEFQQRRSDIRVNLDRMQAEINKLEEERTAILSKIQESQESTRMRRQQVTNMKKDLQYETEEEIDAQLRELEHYMITTSVSLQQEKNLVAKMQNLRKLKPLVRDYASLESEAYKSDTGSIVPLKARLELIRDDLTKLRDRKREESNKNSTLIEERNKNTAPVKELFDRRNEIQNEMAERKKKLLDMKNEYATQKHNYTVYTRELLSITRAAEKQVKKRQDIQYKREKLNSNLQQIDLEADHIPGIHLLQQTVAYTQKLVDEFKGAATEEASPSSVNETSPANKVVDQDVERVCLPKKQREEEVLFAPKGGKKGKKSRMAQRQNEQPKAKTGVISHDLHTLSDFAFLEVKPPLVYSEAEGVLEILNAKLSVLEGRKAEFAEKHSAAKNDIIKQLELLAEQESELDAAEAETKISTDE